MRFYA